MGLTSKIPTSMLVDLVSPICVVIFAVKVSVYWAAIFSW